MSNVDKIYLDYDGLKEYHNKLENQISSKIEDIEEKIQSISIDEENETLIIKKN